MIIKMKINDEDKKEEKRFEKGKTYTYEEIEKRIERAMCEVTTNPFPNAKKEPNSETLLMTSLMSISIFGDLKAKLFEKEN